MGRITPHHTNAIGRPTGRALPFDDQRHLQAHAWLVEEAYLLDGQRYDEWLTYLDDDVRYYMPVTVTRAAGADFESASGMAHFDEDKQSLSQRVARFSTQHAWAEDPPSRLRHFITNVRTFATDDPERVFVESAVLLFRSRGDVNDSSLLSARREDLLRRSADGWRLQSRTIHVDESVLRTQSLSVFL
jgi:3-phenylpropionate/cinnamic acid dioxygenase small subunit